MLLGIAGCSGGGQGEFERETAPEAAIGVTRQAIDATHNTVTVTVDEYWFDEGFDLLDDRDMRATITIDGTSAYKDLEPGCCDGISAIGIPRSSGVTWAKDIPLGVTPFDLKIEMFEDDGDSEDNDRQDITPNGGGSDMNLTVDIDLLRARFNVVGDGQIPSFCGFTGCSICSGPRGQGDGLCFTMTTESLCKLNVANTHDGNCDGIDENCNGLIDDGYVELSYCPLCPGKSSCVNGEEKIPPCVSECNVAPRVTTEWTSYNNGWDFDVAADKLCMISATAAANAPAGNVVCTTEAEGINSHLDLIPTAATFTTGCDTTHCSSHISLDPLGRIWATNPDGIWTTLSAGGPLQVVAQKPAGCSSIQQIELVGPADRNYFGPTARPFVRCGTNLFELVPGESRWISYAQPAWSMGASPRNAFALSLNAPFSATNDKPFLYLMNADGTFQKPWILRGPEDKVGGAFVMFQADPFAQIWQWDGSKLLPVADLNAPLPVPLLDRGKYDILNARQTDPGGQPLKIAEGGGLNIGGPSRTGFTDALWILNDTFRVYSYEVAEIPAAVKDSLRGDDAVPETAAFAFLSGQTPNAVCRDATLDAGPACSAFADASTIDAGSNDPNGDPLTVSLSSAGLFPVGTTSVALTASDGQTSSACSATVTVRDKTPPVLTLPPAMPAALCQTSGMVNIGQATATDNCNAVVTGQVIAINGVTLAQPTDVVGGQAALGIGTNTVRWTATDGVNQVVKLQTVTVGAKMQASQAFLVDDFATVQVSAGTFAAILSSGTLETRIGAGAKVGAIVSKGPVSVAGDALVQGSIVSGGAVTVSPTASTGVVTRNAIVNLPSLPSLPTFPSATGGSFILDSGADQSRAPGSYGAVTLNSNSTLRLGAGDYFFRTLTINSSVRVIVSPTTRIFVRDQLDYRSPFISSSGAPQAITLGFAGTGTLILETGFNGTLIAPSAQVVFGNGPPRTFSGSFYGRILEVRPGQVLACLP
jgi:hypothetical protein